MIEEIVEFSYYEYKGQKLRVRREKVVAVISLHDGNIDWTLIYTDHNEWRVQETEIQVLRILGWLN